MRRSHEALPCPKTDPTTLFEKYKARRSPQRGVALTTWRSSGSCARRLSMYLGLSIRSQNGARRNGYCLLPTIELFKAVCAVLESPEKEEIKQKSGTLSFAL
jgi:hypothetical protein